MNQDIKPFQNNPTTNNNNINQDIKPFQKMNDNNMQQQQFQMQHQQNLGTQNLMNPTNQTNQNNNLNLLNNFNNPLVMFPKNYPDQPLQANQVSSVDIMKIFNEVHQYTLSLPNLLKLLQNSIVQLYGQPSNQTLQNVSNNLQDSMKKTNDAIVALEKIYSICILNCHEILRLKKKKN